MKLRGYLALGVLFVSFPLLDLFQRTILVLWVTLRPSRRLPAMAKWIDFMAGVVVNTVTHVGGAKIQLPPRVVPIEPGTLIVMNHQSVLDIPLTVRSVERGGYPRIVTRARYHRFIPLISHMVRLYQYPVVDPTARPSDLLNSIESLGMEGRGSPVPIAIFPEGTRTRDGEVGRFKKRGLHTLLRQRDWTVYLFVVDGYWKTAKLKHFVQGMGHIDGRIEYLGTAEWTDPEADPVPFILELRDRIAAGLDEMRGRDTADQ